MPIQTVSCAIPIRPANHLLCIWLSALLLLASGGCQAGAPGMAVLSPDQPSAGAATIRLAGRDVRPETHAIFLPEQPTPTERTAAQELQLHLRLITGGELAILPESQRGGRHGFFIGHCRAYALPETESAALGVEGLVIRSHGPDLQLTGNQRGVLYAVSVFLEEYLGCRWFAADCTRLPTSGVISLAAIDRRYVPPLMCRALDYPEHRGTLFAMRNRLTSAGADLDEAHGGKVSYHEPGVHSFNQLVPPEKYFASHPEYYSLIDGKRTAAAMRTQLCLTNPEVLAIAKATVREWIAKDPDAQVFSVSQNDGGGGFCQCEKCAALAKEEGGQAGPLLHFVNAIAEDIARDHPDKIIDTLAYLDTRKPPLHVRPAPNVTVRLCSMECCFSHPLDGCPENVAFMADLRGWSRICRRVSIWDYVIPFYHTLSPWPNLYVLQPNIKTFVLNGATSIYEEANYFSPGGEMAALRTYIMAGALWDPDTDTDRSIDEFLPAYYGAAAPYLRQYIDLVHRPFKEGRGAHLQCGLSPAINPGIYLEKDFLNKAHALFGRARSAVSNDPVRMRRVRLAHMGAIYLTLFERPIYERHGDRLVWSAGPPAGVDAWREFWDVVAIEKITHHQEGMPIKRINDVHILDGKPNPIILPRMASPGELVIHRLHNRDAEVECIPGFGGRIHALINRRTGRDWLKGNHPKGYSLVEDSGSDIYSQRSWRSAGWSTPFEVIQSDGDHVVMKARLGNGLELERRVTLAGGSVVRFRDSIRNASDQPREATLRVHPVFDMTHPESTRLVVRDAAGKDRPVDLPRPANAQTPAADRFLEGDDRPAGVWSIVDDASHERLTQRVISGEVGRYFVNVDYALRQLTLEFWSPTRTLKPGEEIAIEYEYEM
ncbi:MAG: DUF4838 domain-containing protein [Planctomycetes bacterium]|nr:DUF4838 domain-containing protein [Planctomycetota bacterium]